MHHLEKLMTERGYSQKHQEEILDWFYDHHSESEDCRDNERVAVAIFPEEVLQYSIASGSGCCGSVDESIIIDGIEYLVGYNYGH